MEYNRRNRKRKGRSGFSISSNGLTRQSSNKSSLSLNGLCSYFIISILILTIYLLLEYYCNTCNSKCDLYNITKNIENIANNLSFMKDNYRDLEKRVTKFSQEFPKFEGQLEILEALANTMENGDFGWNPKIHLPLPNVDVSLNKPKSTTGKKFGNSSAHNIKFVDVDID
ncbi:unnamed protein product [Parnassius mnemosyne]|uniref:Uncharacterized protein n=1 Tax=Parnassius mnemosyne TaxID=213953 RepID=A0AAV1LML9_9NEOP